METRSTIRRALIATVLLALAVGTAGAGSFVGSESIDPDLIVHPTGYTGTGGPLTVTVCIDPASPNASSMEVSVQNAIATWNGLTPTSPNLVLGTSNDVPATGFDFESVVLHEMGHCLGLGHANLSTESGLTGNDQNYTKTTKGGDAAYDLDDG